jgi:electron transfer flavoprotein beta subunit
MRIVACVKHVPDPHSERHFTGDGRVHRDRLDGTLDGPDEHTVEAAVALAETTGGHVTLLSMGPAHAQDALRRGLQMGAGRAVLVADAALEGSDAFATALVLAAAVRRLDRELPVDLVLTGAASTDAGTTLLPVLLAAELGLPHAAPVRSLTVRDGDVVVRRDVDGVSELLEASLPAVVGVGDRANRPRVPRASAIAAARGVPVTTWTLADLGLHPSQVGRPAARTLVRAADPLPPPADRILLHDDGTAARQVAEYLLEKGLVP